MPDKQNSKDQEQNTGPNVTPSDNTPLPSASPNHVACKRTETPDKNKYPTEYHSRKWSLIFSGLLVVIGAVYSFFSCQQWLAMRGQLAEMKESKYLTRLAERAWVADETISGKAEPDKRYVIKISIKNTGKTFAKNFGSTSVYEAKQLSDPDPDFDHEIVTHASSTNSIGLLPPNGVFDQEVTAKLEEKITEDDIREFGNPTLVFLIFGKITYTDIFKCEHWTTFCCRAFPVEGKYVTYTTYNDADENYCP